MTEITPPVPHEPTRFTVDAYFALIESGAIAADEHVELLEGVIVSMPPSNPPHAAIVDWVAQALVRVVGSRAAVRTEKPIRLGRFSAPEPDIAVVPGSLLDYLATHPATALLVVEVSDSSLVQDRLSKSRIYARAAIPEYWIVDLRDGWIEVMRDPDSELALYRTTTTARRGDRIELVGLPGACFAVGALFES
jgi:Uma2 family endonuclease